MGIEDEVASPRIYYKSGGVIKDIGIYSAQTADDALGYLHYGCKVNPDSDVVSDYYIPYVSLGHIMASDVRVMVNGTEYAIRRQGYTVGTERTLTNIGSDLTLSKYVRNIDSSDGHNISIRIKGKRSYIMAVGKMISGSLTIRPCWDDYNKNLDITNLGKPGREWYASVRGSAFWVEPDDITFTGVFDGVVHLNMYQHPLWSGIETVEIKVWE